jgi:flagellar basal-body rod protein FlgF
MGNGIYIALSGSVAQSDALDVVANNVANAASTGFRAERMSFGQALSRARGQDSAFVGVAGTVTDTSQGTITNTGNPLDVALRGDGYFAVQTPRGERYTRAGSFHVDHSGTLVNADGYAVMSAQSRPINVPDNAKQIVVGADGAIMADGNALGTLDIKHFDQKMLAREGATMFALKAGVTPGATPATPPATAPVEPTEVVGGALEAGNFNIVRGMIDLVKISRNYESLHRMLENYKEIDSRTAQSIGGPK